MPWELREHAGRHYAVLFHYALPDDAWVVELSEAVPASAENPDAAVTHLPGAAFLVALVPDEDPNLQPTVRVYSPDECVVPYEVMRWFMEQVADQVERCRTAFEQEWNDHAVTGVITASEPSWIAPFTGLSPRAFGKLVTVLRREGADAVRRGRPWSLPLADRALLVAAYWRTNLTMRQLAPLFGVSKSAAGRIIDHLGPLLALQPRKRFSKNTVLIVDGTLVPTRDHTIAERSKNYRYSTNHQVVIDADTRLVVVVGRPLAGNRNDCKAWEESGAKAAVGKTTTIADGGYPGTGLVIPHRRERGQTELPAWKEEHNKSHKQVRARVEHVFARMKTWKILRDCRLKGDGVHHAMLGIARMHNLTLAG
jgi:hypothetical protein